MKRVERDKLKLDIVGGRTFSWEPQLDLYRVILVNCIFKFSLRFKMQCWHSSQGGAWWPWPQSVMTSILRLCWARSSGAAAPSPGSSSSPCPYPSWSIASPPTTRTGVDSKIYYSRWTISCPGCGEMRWTWGRGRERGSKPRSCGKCRRCSCLRRCPPRVSVPCAMCHEPDLTVPCAGKMVAEQPDLCGGKVSANKAGQRLHTNTSKLSRIL